MPQHDPSRAHSTLSKPPLAASNAVQVLPPSKEMPLPVGPTARAMGDARGRSWRPWFRSQPRDRWAQTPALDLHERGARPIEVRGVLGGHEAPRAAAVSCHGECVDRLARRSEVTADREAAATVAEGQRDDPARIRAEHRGSRQRSRTCPRRKSGTPGPAPLPRWRTRSRACPRSSGMCRWPAKANSPVSASGIPSVGATVHERPPSRVATMRNLPSTGSRTRAAVRRRVCDIRET